MVKKNKLNANVDDYRVFFSLMSCPRQVERFISIVEDVAGKLDIPVTAGIRERLYTSSLAEDIERQIDEVIRNYRSGEYLALSNDTNGIMWDRQSNAFYRMNDEKFGELVSWGRPIVTFSDLTNAVCYVNAAESKLYRPEDSNAFLADKGYLIMLTQPEVKAMGYHDLGEFISATVRDNHEARLERGIEYSYKLNDVSADYKISRTIDFSFVVKRDRGAVVFDLTPSRLWIDVRKATDRRFRSIDDEIKRYVARLEPDYDLKKTKEYMKFETSI